MKNYNTQFNIGKAKYVVNFHDGVTKYNDGTPFYGIAIFKNKKKFEQYINSLKQFGYIYK